MLFLHDFADIASEPSAFSWRWVFLADASASQHPSTIDRNFQMYDHLLFLQKGGETVYFGDLGHNVTTLIGYFQAHGSRQYKPEENLYDLPSYMVMIHI